MDYYKAHYYLSFLFTKNMTAAFGVSSMQLIYVPGPTTRGLVSAVRHKIWLGSNPSCRGTVVRSICIFGAGDLPDLARSSKLFANKFFMDVQPVAYDCLEELHFNRTRECVTGSRPFNSTFFKSLPFVENALRNITLPDASSST